MPAHIGVPDDALVEQHVAHRRAVSSGPRCASVPKSGLASTAMTRSPRISRQGGAEPDGDGGLADAALLRQHRHAERAAHRLVDPVDERPAARFLGRFAGVVTGGSGEPPCASPHSAPAGANQTQLGVGRQLCTRPCGVGRGAGERCRARQPQRRRCPRRTVGGLSGSATSH